jgi:PKD repeat protein
LGIFCLALVALELNAADSLANSSSTGHRHKVRVNDPALAQKLSQQGAELIADYGSFQFFRVDDNLAQTLANHSGAENENHQNIIALNARPLDTTASEIKALRKAVAPSSGKRLHLVHFAGPIKPEWRDALEQTGVQVITYLPHNAYLVYGHGAALGQMQAWAATANYVQWEGEYLDEYKIHPNARTIDPKGNPQRPLTDLFAIQLVADDQANGPTLLLIDGLKSEPVKRKFPLLNYLNLVVRIPPERLPELAAQPEVISIQPYLEPQKMDERQDIIMIGNLTGNGPTAPGYLAFLSSKGFSQSQFAASGFAVDITDSGLDNGTSSPGHFGLYQLGDSSQASRVVYNRLIGTPNSGSTVQGCDGHGTLNTHIIGGYNDQAAGFPHTDSAGYHYGLGVCPFVKFGSSVIFDPDNFTFPNYPNLQSQAYHDGARISSDSWGANTAGAYDVDAQTYDALVRDAQPSGSTFSVAGNQEMVIVFAAGNAGSGAQTVGSPGTAKNVITVGASENVRSLSTANGGNDPSGNTSCGVNDSSADSANDIAFFSSRGPCSDGRKKPEIVGPGTHITGGVAQNSPPPSPSTTGSAIACFKGTGVCALPGEGTVSNANNFFPLNQQFYTTSSGTSHSTPAVAGSCALLRQFFINSGLNAPSPAMTKAFLMNSARYLNGSGANDSLWSNNQGMGEVNLGTALDGTARIVRDEVAADKFTATGQTRTFTGTIPDPSKPFRVTVAWTDAPGNTSGNAFNNDLDLTVTVGGNTYKGNVFSGALSVTGGTADHANNAESVFLPAGTSGGFSVTITAANINSDGVPNQSPSLDQDFGLVVYNGTQVAAPIVAADTTAVVAESCTPTNGAPDPGETLTISFGFRNIGSANSTNLIATLLTTNGVTSPSAAQSYGALAAGGATVFGLFTFTANGVCGTNINPTFQLQDGSANLGTVSFSFQMGQLASMFSENFDGVANPALPSGWTTATTGAQSSWVTSVSSSDSAPNAVFSPDPGAVGLNELDTPVINLPASSTQLAFRHSYNLETASGSTGYDGGVLEIKIGGGAFTDILAAGGSFVSGGYDHTISSSFSNPLAGRQAWSGNSGGFITTIVNLPASASGQAIQLRWRCGSDSSVSSVGWFVDTVSIQVRACCGQLSPPSAAFIATPTSGSAPLSVLFTDNSTGTITNRSWNFGNGLTTNTTATSFSFLYLSVGTNTVSLTVRGPTGTNTVTQTGLIVVTNLSPLIVSNSFALAAESCVNGAIDPGETVTVNLGLANIGSRSTTNLVATLRSGSGITAPSGSQSYGTLLPGGGAVVKPFSLTATGVCGGVSIATLQLQDGTLNLGTVSFAFSLGQSSVFSQNFDSVSAPALPVGWTTSGSNAQTAWITSTFSNSSAPNAAFSIDGTNVGINELDSPTFTLPASPGPLTFRHSWDLEAPTTGTTGYDGGVLEIKIGGGAFTDILTAGGSFVSGGYTRTISTAYSNPLGGRQAWSGSSGGFVTTTVNLPVAAAGQTIQLRWRCGTDNGVTNIGWFLDNLSIGGQSCCTNAPIITSQPTNQTVLTGANASFVVSAGGTAPLAYQWRFNGTNLSGATSSTLIRSNVQASMVGSYNIVITNVAGSATSSVATLGLLVQPSLLAPRASNRTFTFMLSGNAGFNYAVEASTNFSNWISVATVTDTTGQVPFTETNTSAFPFRFYRARLLP